MSVHDNILVLFVPCFWYYCKHTRRYSGDFCNPMWPRWFSTEDEKWELCTFGKKAFVEEEKEDGTSARDTSALKLQIATTLVLFCHPVFFSRQNTFSEEKSTRHVWPLLKCNNHCICEYLSNFRRDLAFAFYYVSKVS